MATFPAVKSKNKVLLFFPRLSPDDTSTKGPVWEPIPVIALAGHLLNYGFRAEIYDSRTREDIQDVLEDLKDDLLCVGVSAMPGYQVVEGYDFTRYFKERYPHIPVIWGGWYPTIAPKQCLDNPFIDMVIKGQGEKAFPELATRIASVAPVNDMVGLSYKENGRNIHNMMVPLTDPNELLPLNYELVDISHYSLKTGLLHYVTSVGCPYMCSFCSVSAYYKGVWYSLHPERVVSEIKTLRIKYDLKEVEFFDSIFSMNDQRTKEILRGFLREKVDIEWSASTHVDHVAGFDNEMLDLLQASRCRSLGLGIESGSSRIRKMFRKNFSDETINRAINKLTQAGVPIRANYILWPPSEEREDFMATIRSMIHVRNASPKNRIVALQYIPIPGTPLAKLEKEERKRLLPKTIDDWNTFFLKTMQIGRQVWSAGDRSWRFPVIGSPLWSDGNWFGRLPILLYFKLGYLEIPAYARWLEPVLKMVRKVAAFRLKHEIFILPVEWYFFRLYRFLKIKNQRGTGLWRSSLIPEKRKEKFRWNPFLKIRNTCKIK